MKKNNYKYILFAVFLIMIVTIPVFAENVNYSNFCGNPGVTKVMKILGSVVYILKFIGPLLIIVFGVIDYAKAVVSSDENALNKATESLIRRIISGVVVFLIPSILWGLLNVIDITDGMHDLNNTEFGTCTKCLLRNECSVVVDNSTNSNSNNNSNKNSNTDGGSTWKTDDETSGRKGKF